MLALTCVVAPMYPISTYLGKRFGVMKWIPANVFVWGLFSLLHAFMKTKAQFYAFRAMVAICEAGFYPCKPKVTTHVDHRSSKFRCRVLFVQLLHSIRLGSTPRIALCQCHTLISAYDQGAYSIAGSFGSLIAYGMLRIHGSLYGVSTDRLRSADVVVAIPLPH